MTTIRHCGWCEPKPADRTVGEVFLTTGICEKCSAKLLAELEPTPEPVPYESRPGTFYGHYGV